MNEFSQKFDQLELLEGQLQRCDEEILILVKRRQHIIRKISEFKVKKKLEINSSSEEDRLFQERISKCREMGLNQLFANNLFELLFEDAEKVRLKVIEKKK